MTTGEDAHGCDYFTQVFLSPELCNSTQSRGSVAMFLKQTEIRCGMLDGANQCFIVSSLWR